MGRCYEVAMMSRHRKRLRDPLEYSLTELEEHDWGSATFDSHLVNSVHELRYVPLKELSHDNVRLLIGQRVGLVYLVPLAIEALRTEPLVEATFFQGDLLSAVMRVNQSFWSTHEELAVDAKGIAQLALKSSEIDERMKAEIHQFLGLPAH